VIVFHNNRVFNDLSPEAGLAIFIVTASAPLGWKGGRYTHLVREAEMVG